jgi:hypothetical protein
MTNPLYQRTFDHIVRHMYKQGKPAASEGGCYYRTANSDFGGPQLSCAIGCLIPDDKYDESLEGVTPATRYRGYNEWDPNEEVDRNNGRVDLFWSVLAPLGFADNPADREFLQRLQTAHDTAMAQYGITWFNDFASRMRKVAEDYEISTDVIDSVTAHERTSLANAINLD